MIFAPPIVRANRSVSSDGWCIRPLTTNQAQRPAAKAAASQRSDRTTHPGTTAPSGTAPRRIPPATATAIAAAPSGNITPRIAPRAK